MGPLKIEQREIVESLVKSDEISAESQKKNRYWNPRTREPDYFESTCSTQRANNKNQRLSPKFRVA